MSAVKLNDGRTINAKDVSSVELHSRHYVNGSEHHLTITMRDGRVFGVKHSPQYLGGADAFAIKKEIESAM